MTNYRMNRMWDQFVDYCAENNLDESMEDFTAWAEEEIEREDEAEEERRMERRMEAAMEARYYSDSD